MPTVNLPPPIRQVTSAMFHLTTRVAWHDSRWGGSICQAPSCNSFCTALDRIREERDDDAEDALAGKPWHALLPEQLPPCQAESGAFMNPTEWTRRFKHPYADIRTAAETHGHLVPTLVRVPSFATFAVPFAWMLRSEQKAIDERLPTPLPPDEESPFNSPWVFGRARQEAILNLFSSHLTEPGAVHTSAIRCHCPKSKTLCSNATSTSVTSRCVSEPSRTDALHASCPASCARWSPTVA